MYKRPTSRILAIVAALTVSAALSAGAAAQNDGKKKPSATASGTTQKSAPGTSSARRSRAGQTVFRPKETIAPGKPVSFPADI